MIGCAIMCIGIEEGFIINGKIVTNAVEDNFSVIANVLNLNPNSITAIKPCAATSEKEVYDCDRANTFMKCLKDFS